MHVSTTVYFPPKPVEQVRRIAYRHASRRYAASSPAYMERVGENQVRFIDSDGYKHLIQNPKITFNDEVQRLRDNPALYTIVQEE